LDSKFPRQYEILFQKAKADLAISFHSIDAHDEDIDNAVILFHFQQAVEKLIKVLLSCNKIHFEKVHDIAMLIDLCNKCGVPLPEYIDEFIVLNIFAVVGRYDIVDDSGIDPDVYRVKLVGFKRFVERVICY
jgi:HEPN domain-containing protein